MPSTPETQVLDPAQDDLEEKFNQWMENIVTRTVEAANKIATQIATAKTGGDTNDEAENKENVVLREKNAGALSKVAHVAVEMRSLKTELDKAGLTKSSKKIVNAQKKIQRALAQAEAAARAKGIL